MTNLKAVKTAVIGCGKISSVDVYKRQDRSREEENLD